MTDCLRLTSAVGTYPTKAESACGIGMREANTLPTMKTVVAPQVRVEPELRAEIDAVLQEGETLSGFVEASVRSAVEFRRRQTRFRERGRIAWEHYQSTGVSVSADEVLARIQAKLDAKRKQLGG